MVICGIKYGIMGSEERGLVSPVKINSVAIEESREDAKEKVHIYGQCPRQNHHGQSSHELVEVLISNYSEWCRIKKHMVMFMYAPEETKTVPTPVIYIFKEIGKEKNEKCLFPKCWRRRVEVFNRFPAISLRLSPVHASEGVVTASRHNAKRRTERGHNQTLAHMHNLFFDKQC